MSLFAYKEDSPESLALSGALKQHYCEFLFFSTCEDENDVEKFCRYLQNNRPYAWHILLRVGRDEKFVKKQVESVKKNEKDMATFMNIWKIVYHVDRYRNWRRQT